MPSPGKIVLVRHDGTRLEATKEQADRLAILGYTPESADLEEARHKTEAATEFYTTPDQRAITAIEGFGAGLTLGGTDYLLGDDDTKARAAHNPGTRLGTEVLGAIVPSLLTGGAGSAITKGAQTAEASGLAKAAKLTPSGLLSDAARALAPGKSGSLTKAVTSGMLEGGAFGAAGVADRAYLDGEPLTGEAVLHGIGWGAVMGGALSAIGRGVTKTGEAEQAAIEAASRPPVPHGALHKAINSEYQMLKSEVASISKQAKQATKMADTLADDYIKEFKQAARVKAADGHPSGRGHVPDEVIENIDSVKTLYNKVDQAVRAGQFDKATEAAQLYSQKVQEIGKMVGADMPPPNRAMDDLIGMRAVERELRSMPSSPEAFASLSPQRYERLAAAMNRLQKLPLENTKSIVESADAVSRALGVEPMVPGDLRSAWRSARTMYKQEGQMPVITAKDKEPSLMRRMAGFVAGAQAYGITKASGVHGVMPWAAYHGVKNLITKGGPDLAAVRADSVGRTRQAAANYLPGVGRAIQRTSPAAVLSRSIFGEKDDSSKDIRTLAANRVKEITQLAPTIKDTAFRAVEPLSVAQPNLAPAMHQAAITSFQALLNLTPKSTGVINALQPVWKPSELQAATLAKQLEVFHNPIGVSEAMLASGRFDAVQVRALREMAPSIWQELRVAVMERISQPEVGNKLTYSEQIGLSNLLDLPIHTSMTPGQIATSQQIFMDRAAPLPANPRIGQNGGPPNPADNVNSTSAQRSTQR